MRVLLLEDHAGIRSSLEMLLELDGHQTVAFERGDEALGFLRHQDVDLVLMDWNTPGITGQGFLDGLDEVCLPLFRPRVGILSGDRSAQVALERQQAEFFYLKPFSMEQVMRQVSGGTSGALALPIAG